MHCSSINKIFASIIKPTREGFLDYCSYFIIVIALIGVARVWIGGSTMRINCPQELFEKSDQFPKEFGTLVYTSRPSPLQSDLEENEELLSGNGKFNEFTSPDNVGVNKLNESLNESGSIVQCAKYYQTVFAYILLVESTILLFSGLIWDKVPKVTHTLKRFTEIVEECQASDWVKNALNIITDKRQSSDISQSLYSVISSENTIYDMKSLLDTLFHPNGDYKAKAKARHLYEKVQTFCESHSVQTNIWNTYIIKSLLQFILWITIFNINLVLFVTLEFYYICPEDSIVPCDHDTFLRIIWFMGQTVILIYGVFNCKTLKWINEKSIVRRRSCCNISSCLRRHRTLYTSDDTPLLTCRAFRFSDNPPVFNDVAILLHLFEEACPKILPYFVVFMFPEWKEKLTSFANPVQMSEMPLRSSMQMLSGRPPPIIEITDIPLLPEIEENNRPDVLKKKEKQPSVTFFIESELEDSSHMLSVKNDTKTQSFHTKKVSSAYQSATLPAVKFSPLTQIIDSNNSNHNAISNSFETFPNYIKEIDLSSTSRNHVVPVKIQSGSSVINGDELTTLIHRTSSADSDLRSLNATESNSGDASETHPLLD
ncbi:uncharacterized protein LOC120337934 [Styela clava]